MIARKTIPYGETDRKGGHTILLCEISCTITCPSLSTADCLTPTFRLVSALLGNYRGGVPRMQKLKAPLMGAQGYQRFPLSKHVVDQNI